MTWQRLLAQSMAVLEGGLGKERVAREDLFFHLTPQDISVTFAVTVLSTTNVTINDTSGYIIHVYDDLRQDYSHQSRNRVKDLKQTDGDQFFKKGCFTAR